MAILKVSDVSKHFPGVRDPFRRPGCLPGRVARSGAVHALSNVSLCVDRGEVMGLVGESGCGKSTLSRIVSGIFPPCSGSVLFRGGPVMVSQGRRNIKTTTGIQMIFQDPYASLNRRHRIVDAIAEGPLYHGLVARREIDDYVCEKMSQAGLDPGFRFHYPHEFSGGQRQRIVIARALAMRPDLLVCDEAVAALDVSIQAQMINLFLALKERFFLTYLFVSHDLGVIRHVSDRVSVMYMGRIVEQARADDIFARPNHPYSRALLDNMRSITDRRPFAIIKGEIPSPIDPPSGCGFHPRCPFAIPRCRDIVPVLTKVSGGHFSACHLNNQQ